MDFDAVDFEQGFSREVCCSAVRAAHNGDILNYQKSRALPIAPRYMPDLTSWPAAIFAAKLASVSLHIRFLPLDGGT